MVRQSIPSEDDYRPFPDRPDRNARQQHIEVPLFVRCLGLRDRRRILDRVRRGCRAAGAAPTL